MAEEMKNQETMDDFAKEIDASFESFRDADMDIWEKLEKMKEDKTECDHRRYRKGRSYRLRGRHPRFHTGI